MSKNFDCLFVSYAKCDKDCTSWVELIAMRDLEAALKSEDKMMTIKLINLATLKYTKAECEVHGYQSPDYDSYTCRLVFGPTEHNKKEEIEQGRLDIIWVYSDLSISLSEVFSSEPSDIYYKATTSSDILNPSFAFLEHRENGSEYFNFVNYKGQISRRSEIFYCEEHEKAREAFPPTTYNDVYAYVKKEIVNLREFSIATRWPSPWPSELMPIYEVLGDEIKSAYFLSALIQKAVMESEYEWTVCKIRLPGRERRSLYFYRTENLKEID